MTRRARANLSAHSFLFSRARENFAHAFLFLRAHVTKLAFQFQPALARACFLASALWLLPAVSVAAAEEGSRFQVWFEAGNLLLLLAVVFFVARRPVLAYLRARREKIQVRIAEAEQLLSAAEARLGEWQARADALAAETEEIKRSTRRAAERQRETILAEAQAVAERIRAQAEAGARREWFRARENLRRETAQHAIEVAARVLREQVSGDDRARLVDEFIERLAADTPPSPVAGGAAHSRAEGEAAGAHVDNSPPDARAEDSPARSSGDGERTRSRAGEGSPHSRVEGEDAGARADSRSTHSRADGEAAGAVSGARVGDSASPSAAPSPSPARGFSARLIDRDA